MKSKRVRGEIVTDIRRRFVDGAPEDAIARDLVRRKDAKDAKEATSLIAEARKLARKKLTPDELSEIARDLVIEAKTAGDFKGALAALKAWERWQGCTRRFHLASLVGLPLEDQRAKVQQLVATGYIEPADGIQMLAAMRDSGKIEEDLLDPDIEVISDEEALAIALGRG